MKKSFSAAALVLGLFFLAGTAAHSADSTPATSSTNTSTSEARRWNCGQLTNFLNVQVDLPVLADQIFRWNIHLDVETYIYLKTNGITDTNLFRLQEAINYISNNSGMQVPRPSMPTDGVNSNLVTNTNLDIHVRQVAAMFQMQFPTTNIVNYMSQCGLKLDAVTVFNLSKTGIALEQITGLEKAFNDRMTQDQSADLQNARLKLAGVTNLNHVAITSLSVAATNVPMARTNLPVLAEYAQRMAANLSLMGTNGDAAAFLSVTNDLAEIAAGIKGYAGNLQTSTTPTNSNWLVALSAGAQFLNPYNIDVPTGATNGPNGTLKNSGNSTVGYLQLDVQRHWVIAPYSPSKTDVLNNRFPVYGALNYLFRGDKTNSDFNMKSLTPDFQFTFGFLLGNSADASTNSSYSAQTLAGSDIYGTLGAGIPLWRNDYRDDNDFAVQVSLWASIGVTTAKSFEKIHANEFIGGVLDIGLPNDIFGNTNVLTRGLITTKIGMGHLDFPSLSGTDNQVYLNGNGQPIFLERWVPEAGANLFIPFGSVLYLNVEANTFLGDVPPNQWNVKVGATIPWTAVKQMFPFIK